MSRHLPFRNVSPTSSGLPNSNNTISEDHSDNLAVLRRQWKWAAFSQFFDIFFDLFAMTDVSLIDVENDLVNGSCLVIPGIMQRLLFTLSQDRKISPETWQRVLQKQYQKRDPQANPLVSAPLPTPCDSRMGSVAKGEDEDHLQQHNSNTSEISNCAADHLPSNNGPLHYYPENLQGGCVELDIDTSIPSESMEHEIIQWNDLPMLQKLNSLHSVMEWQFQNPLRLRSIMKSDDETASWRSEPVGYDRMRNSYWFIGHRLWIQRVPPKPASLKRKRRETNKPDLSSNAPEQIKRLRIHNHEDLPTKAQAKGGRSSRAAKEHAKIKLDIQAKELAEFNLQATILTHHTASRNKQQNKIPKDVSTQLPTPKGVRVSARLRGIHEDGWQRVPDEWLNANQDNSTVEKAKANPKTGLESDYGSVSDLTELSEETTPEPPQQSTQLRVVENTDDSTPQANFTEWETICVTLSEWEHYPDQFSNSTHYNEKAFYKFLVRVLVPQVTAELKQLEQNRLLEEALLRRKRSSRLATKESEREAARLADQKRVEEAEKLSRARRLEVRLQKETAERFKREKAREQRRIDREAREVSRKLRVSPYANDIMTYNGECPSPAPLISSLERSGQHNASDHHTKSGSRTPAGDDWELDCEICGQRGMNVDDGTPMMSCGFCLKWQHILCHDRINQIRGLPKRDWDSIEFICQRCLMFNDTSKADIYRNLGINPSNNPHSDEMPPMSFTSQEEAASRILSSFREATTSNTPSSAPAQFSPSSISFSHYQPHERAFTIDTNRRQTQYTPPFNQLTSPLTEVAKFQSYPTRSPRTVTPPHPSSYYAQNIPLITNNVNVQQIGVTPHQRHYDLNRPWETRLPPPISSVTQNQIGTTQFRFHSTSYSPHS